MSNSGIYMSQSQDINANEDANVKSESSTSIKKKTDNSGLWSSISSCSLFIIIIFIVIYYLNFKK